LTALIQNSCTLEEAT
jgi:hypothetical protein